MPLPTPNKDEEQGSFISRCMSNKHINKEGRDSKQKVAMCYSQWRRAKSYDVSLSVEETEMLNKLIASYEEFKAGG